MTTRQPRLVRLRTAPMPDPGEWCLWQSPQTGWNWCDMYDGKCLCGHDTTVTESDGIRRPQSCIDAAEEVET